MNGEWTSNLVHQVCVQNVTVIIVWVIIIPPDRWKTTTSMFSIFSIYFTLQRNRQSYIEYSIPLFWVHKLAAYVIALNQGYSFTNQWNQKGLFFKLMESSSGSHIQIIMEYFLQHKNGWKWLKFCSTHLVPYITCHNKTVPPGGEYVWLDYSCSGCMCSRGGCTGVSPGHLGCKVLQVMQLSVFIAC